MGTGMAFPWKLISNVSMASGHLVEDMKLGIDLARMGKPPMFCADALVTSTFPDSVEGTQTQRTRWEHGHLGMIISEAPKQLLQAVIQHNGALFALLLDMCIPPLALILLLVVTLFGLATVLFLAGGSVIALLFSAKALLLMGTAVLAAWWKFGRQIISLKDLIYAPIYALIKIPLYLKFLVFRQVEWVRSKRDGD
jgi:cellulose synthase/poly-beta-1,6-N-acetylglucosamine synthase-like glycosyltransferase